MVATSNMVHEALKAARRLQRQGVRPNPSPDPDPDPNWLQRQGVRLRPNPNPDPNRLQRQGVRLAWG